MYECHTLPNGIKIILNHTPSRVVYSGVYINVGSRDDECANPDTHHAKHEGIAHFIEHSLFKGTTHRRAHHILNRIDGVGGELNAFTTKEETCIYATSLREHLPRCLELFADVLFCSTFPEAEIEREKEVVLEEINSYNDSPSELIYDQFEELAYEGHPLAHNILGTKRNVRHFSPAMLSEHMHRNYTPSRMVISVVGDVSFSRVVKLCERYFGHYEDHPSLVDRTARPQFHQFTRTIHRHTHQAHLLIGCEAPTLYDKDKTAFTLLNNILGGPAMNSRLNVGIRERYGFCYNVESQYVPFSDTGLFYIYAGVDTDAIDRTLAIVKHELANLAETALTPRQLLAAQRQFIGQLAINNDNGSNEMQGIGKAYLCFDHVDSLEEMQEDIMAQTPADLLNVAQRLFDTERLSTLIYC